ncbi:hypothetical protein MPSEU_000753700 [Mayamaea pseudoterrestris]|nr:hypothetical protein MPSEU_000753700 [Mayamaea pseudoterrestris]
MSSSRGGGRGGRGGRPVSRNLGILQETSGHGQDGQVLLYNITHPSLYADIYWHSSGRRRSLSQAEMESMNNNNTSDPALVKSEMDSATTAATPLSRPTRPSNVTYMLSKQDEIRDALRKQSDLLAEAATTQSWDERRELMQRAMGRLDANYIPEELFGLPKRKKQKTSRNAAAVTDSSAVVPDAAPVSWNELAEREAASVNAHGTQSLPNSASNVKAEQQQGLDDEQQQDDFEEDDELAPVDDFEQDFDYGQNHYDSDDNGDSDGGGGDGEAVF